jgi:hypothetical protein
MHFRDSHISKISSLRSFKIKPVNGYIMAEQLQLIYHRIK